jgi:hypothetical protein
MAVLAEDFVQETLDKLARKAREMSPRRTSVSSAVNARSGTAQS